jgi:hypothetical protein
MRGALPEALRVWALSRLLVAAVATTAYLKANQPRSKYDFEGLRPFDGWPLHGLLDALFAPLARFDTVSYLGIAQGGYDSVGPQGPAFFPLYPLLTYLLSGLAASPGAALLAATALSLAAFLGALYLLHRLVALDLGPELARPTLLLLAFFPTALFFSAPYTESLFLLVSVGAVYAARTGHWAWAGVLAGAASATRVPGIALFLPLTIMYLWGPRESAAGAATGWRPRFPLRRDAAWLALAPLGLVAFSVHLDSAVGDALAWLHAQDDVSGRDLTFPLVTAWDAVRTAGAGVKAIAEGSRTTFPAGENLVNLGVLVFAIVALVGVFRRLHVAYGLYSVAALLPAFLTPFEGEPLLSLPRFLAVLFPVFMWLALACEERGWTDRVLVASAVLLGLFTAEHATGVFVS